MLNREKLFKALQDRTQPFFAAYATEQQVANTIFERIAHDPLLSSKLMHCSQKNLLPTWQGALAEQVQTVIPQNYYYAVLAVDGSQIYPDRHQGLDCYLINIGTALFNYAQKSSVVFTSEPFLFFNDSSAENFEPTPELINCQRTEFELKVGYELSTSLNGCRAMPCPGSGAAPSSSCFLLDGSLIFWHLDGHEPVMKNRFIKSYLSVLQQLYEKRVLHAGYISLPKSRELVNVLRAAMTLPEYAGIGKNFEGRCLVDSDIVSFFLQPLQRTIIFENNSPIVALYAAPLRPCFFYLHTGSEIVRIEIPAWIAQEPALVDELVRVILDQTKKGNGYPVCLAEAHEQAVVKMADRELFYLLLQKVMQDKKIKYTFSQKSMHKRVLGI